MSITFLRRFWKLNLVLWPIVCAAAVQLRGAQLQLVGTGYSPDIPFPQFMHLWSENWALQGEDGEPKTYATRSMALGACIHVFVRNDSTNAASIKDARFAGVSLNEAIAFSDRKAARRYPASVHFSKLTKAEIDRVIAAGEPIWWKVDPAIIPAAGFGEIVVRLRRPLTNAMTTFEVVAGQGDCRAEIAGKASPRFESISFSPALDTVYAYVGRPENPQRAPAKIFLDGHDVTSETEVCYDAKVDVCPLVVRLARPLAKGSLHFFQASFGDGPSANATARAWSEDFVYGMWGYVNHGDTPEARVDYFLNDLKRHNINTVMHSYGGEVGNYLAGQSGLEHSRLTGIRAMRPGPGKDLNPVYYFLMDEPDAHDFAVNQLPLAQRLGTLGQDIVRTSREFRKADPATPQLLNVDNTYKPENWLTYAQLSDVYCADPYFQEQQRIVWNERPAWAASFVKPLYVLGVATICNWACAPRPLHIILNSVRHGSVPGGFRYATPGEKTVELFYALGAGTKSFSYWWYTPYGEFIGCGAPEKEAVALWREIGLLGAQVRTAGPILTRSCRAALPLKASAKLWTRTLLAGSDTVVLLAVNDNIASDRLGTVVVPLPQSVVTITPPGWLKVVSAFEITPEGLRDVSWKASGSEIILDLGSTRVARMIVVTADESLRGRLEKLHHDQFAGNVAALVHGPERSATGR